MKRRYWKKEELNLLKQKYPDTPTEELARQLNRSVRSVYSQAIFCGLKKSPEYLQIHGGRIRPGERRGIEFEFGKRPPHNKGKKGWKAGGNAVKTQFKKGNTPQTWVPIGSERVSKDGLLYRKVSDTRIRRNDWRSVQNLIWEQHNGPVPPGHIVVFLNGDKRDFRLENLKCITRAENMRRNSVHNLPAELAQIFQLIGAINRKIKRKRNEKQNRRP